MRARYVVGWLFIIAGVAAFCAWQAVGINLLRRRFHGVPEIQESSRTAPQFVAIVLPRITLQPHRYAMSASELTQFLEGLKAAGYVSVGLDDVTRLYREHRQLPPKALLIGFAQDDPQGIETADDVMKGLRLRGVAFISRLAVSGTENERRFLTRHAVDDLLGSGAWEIGRNAQDATGVVLEAGQMPDRLRFLGSEMGLNDESSAPSALRILTVRPDREANENLAIVRNSWPRTSEFSDDFLREGLRADWIAGWGVVSMGNGRLAILPTPRQSGAGVFLRGTDHWRDQTIEFELKRYQKEFWAYARYDGDERYVRVGARGGFWYVEQKAGPKSLTSMLGRAPIQEGSLPARVRLVLKGDSAIVHVNGRMLFGRALRVHPAVQSGRVLLGVYDGKSRSALAVLTSLRARPLGEEWITFKPGSGGFDEEHLGGLREEAIHARAISPSWVQVTPDGKVSVSESQGALIRSLAGFYRCRLVPMADIAGLGPSTFQSPERVERLAAGLTDAAGELDAAGLNLRLRDGESRRPETIAFLRKLHAAFHARGWELWLTVDGSLTSGGTAGQSVDGILKRSKKIKPDFELLEASNQ